MRFSPPGRFSTPASFRDHLRSLEPDFGMDAELEGQAGPLGQRLVVDDGGREVGNRFAIQPMEGWDGTREGLPSEDTKRRWHRFGRSGAKLIWGGEAFAVRRDGRANANQLYLNPEVDVANGLAELRAEILRGHRERGLTTDDLYIGLQLTHSGRYSRPDGEAKPLRACVHPVLDEDLESDEVSVLTDAELEAIGECFVDAAKVAQEAGFDFVDVKCCHGYLLHELLSARSRPGPYGGSLENRTRLFRRIVEGIQGACTGLAVAVRVSIADTFPHWADPATGIGEARGMREHLPYLSGFGVDPKNPSAFDLEEPFEFLRLVEGLGIRLVNVTLGTPYYCPHLQRPATYPPSDGYEPPVDPLLSVYSHLNVARACKAAFPKLIIVGSAYSYLQEWLPYVAQHEVRNGHVDLVGLGRMTLSYPELPYDVLNGLPIEKRKLCRTFSDCTTGPRLGLRSGCFPLDDYYRDSPEAERIKAFKRDRRGA